MKKLTECVPFAVQLLLAVEAAVVAVGVHSGYRLEERYERLEKESEHHLNPRRIFKIFIILRNDKKVEFSDQFKFQQESNHEQEGMLLQY